MGSLQGMHANAMTWGSVFDGHGGTHVSSTAASKMHSVVESNAQWRMLSGKSTKRLLITGIQTNLHYRDCCGMGGGFLITYLRME